MAEWLESVAVISDMPIYGCSALGKEWRFFVLIGKEFAVSKVYIITQNEILDIVRILKVLKSEIEAFKQMLNNVQPKPQ